MKNKILDFVMRQMCDEYCKFPNYSTMDEDTLSDICSRCPLALFMELMDK